MVSTRFHSMIAAINGAFKTHIPLVTFPANKFCYQTLLKFREYGLITGLNIIPNRQLDIKKKFKSFRGFPLITVTLNTVPGYIQLKGYSLTSSNFYCVKSKEIQRNIKTRVNRHSRHRHILLTTSEGLRWDYEITTKTTHVGGKLLLSVIKRH